MILLLSACSNLQPMDPDQPCREAGFAIAARTEECTGDTELANARFEQFADEYVCIAVDPLAPEWNNAAVQPQDLFDCAFTIRELACELVDAYADDLDRWLSSSTACAWVVARRDGEPIEGPVDTGPTP